MILADVGAPGLVFMAIFLAFAAMIMGLLSRQRERKRASGTPALDGVWEFLHEPEEIVGEGTTRLRGELSDGRRAQVTVLNPGVLQLDFSLDLKTTARFTLDADSFASVERGEQPWPEGFAPAPGTDAQARRALAQLFADYDLENIVVSEGELRARRVLKFEDRMRESPRILQLLGVVARAIDPPRDVTVTVGQVTNGAVRCSYCHESFAPADETHVCEGCGTVLHASCSEELGRCPVLGCDGKGRVRVRVR